MYCARQICDDIDISGSHRMMGDDVKMRGDVTPVGRMSYGNFNLVYTHFVLLSYPKCPTIIKIINNNKNNIYYGAKKTEPQEFFFLQKKFS